MKPLFFSTVFMENILSDIKLCITGGSGFIGTTAMSWAISKYKTINFDIRPPKILEHQKYWRYVDIRNAQSTKEALVEFQPTHILHLAAMTGMEIHDMSFFDANTKGVANLIKASQELKNLKRILFTSSLLVCPNGHVPTSDSEYNPPNLYGKSKVIGEKLVRESQISCSWVIVRPTSIWGPWFEHSYRTFFRLVDRGYYFQPGSKPIVKPLSFVGNTIHMMQTLLLHPDETVNRGCYYLGDYPENSIQEWADLIRKNIGKRKSLVFPKTLLRLIAITGDLLKKIGWTDPPLTNFRLNNMLTASHYPIEKTQKVVGKLPYTFEQGVNQTLSWMYDQDLIQNEPITLKIKIAVILPSLAATAPIFVARDIINGLITKGAAVDVYYFDEIVEVTDFNLTPKKITFFSKINFKKYDFIHSHTFRADLYVFWHNLLFKKPNINISTVHSMVKPDLLDRFGYLPSVLFSRAWFIAWSKMSKIVVLSDVALDNYRKLLPSEASKLVKINNGRDVDMSNLPSDYKILKEKVKKFKQEGKIVVGTCCSVRHIKGLNQMIEALMKDKSLVFLLVGEGPELTKLKQTALNSGVSTRFLSVGHKQKAYQYMPLFDVYVMPSLSEGFPLALLEAVALKMKIVCSNLAIFIEAFTENEITFFKLNDIESLIHSIHFAYNDHSKSQKAFNRYLNQYTVKSMTDRYHSLFLQIVNKSV